MNIVIRNYVSASLLLEREPNEWDAIIILDSMMPHSDFVERHTLRHLYLPFDDVDTDTPGKRTPLPQDVLAALEFAKRSENLLVCRRAGQSRSAAIAFLICCQRLDSESARNLLNPERHIPNSLVVNLGAPLVDDPTVHSTFDKWRADNRHVRLSDFYDEIEHEFDELERQGARDLIGE